VGSVTERERKLKGGREKRRVPGRGIIARLQIIGQALPPPSRACVRACSCWCVRRGRRQWDVTRFVHCILRGSWQGWLAPENGHPCRGVVCGTLGIGVRVVTVSNPLASRVFSRHGLGCRVLLPTSTKRRKRRSKMQTIVESIRRFRVFSFAILIITKHKRYLHVTHIFDYFLIFIN